MTWRALKGRMKHSLKFMGVGIFMTVVNGVVLWVLVSGAGLFPVLANVIRMPCTTQLHFYIHKKFTWKGEHTTTLWQQWYRFHALIAGSTIMNQLGFVVLTVWMSMPYMLAYLVSLIVPGTINLLVAEKLVFPRRTEIASPPTPSKLDAPAM